MRVAARTSRCEDDWVATLMSLAERDFVQSIVAPLLTDLENKHRMYIDPDIQKEHAHALGQRNRNWGWSVFGLSIDEWKSIG